MDLHTPLDPRQFEHLRVATMRRSTHRGPYCCSMCCRPYGDVPRDEGLCDHPRCWQLARELGWIL